MTTVLTPTDVLGVDGRIARRLSHYEHRPEQLEMADAVTEAIRTKSHLLVEAGTGVGKSFAYLVPAILEATRHQGEEKKRRRILISTHTISLQEQLIEKDIPFLNAVLPVEFSAVLAKGRSNYLSLRRLAAAGERSATLFDDPSETNQLRDLRSWAELTTDGSRSTLPFAPRPNVWDEVRSEQGNCLGRRCPTYEKCFYYKARRRVWNADVLVVNHALFFSDLALRRQGASVLPDYDVVVLDEAHTIEQVAGDHLGLAATEGQVAYALNKLYNDRAKKGLLLHHNLPKCQQEIMTVRYLADEFFDDLYESFDGSGGTIRIREPLGIKTALTNELAALANRIRHDASKIRPEEQQIELMAMSDRLDGLAQCVNVWLNQSLEDAAYWIEIPPDRRYGIKLMSAPIDVGPVLEEEMFGQIPTVILTSATLSTGRHDFRYIRNRLGMTGGHDLQLGSPFDYREQAKLIVSRNLPDPSADPQAFERALQERIPKYLAQTDGHAFVLFTSYRMLRSLAQRLRPWLIDHGMTLLCQGEGLERTRLLERFRSTPRSVLFGTESFWQGVDVPGDMLRNVIITKLPFSVPDHPLLEARVERIREQGGNPFMDYQVPEAIIKLKQGFGRLIRSRTDSGQVVILDPRIVTKRYGRMFLESLPECDIIHD